jgi:sucrose phosphorylase
VQRLLALIKFRNEYDVFDGEFKVTSSHKDALSLCREKGGLKATLHVDFNTNTATIIYKKNEKEERFIV